MEKKYTLFLLQGKIASSSKYNTHAGNLGSVYTGGSPHWNSIMLLKSLLLLDKNQYITLSKINVLIPKTL